MKQMEKKRYDAIDGLRTIACIGIVMMHMQTNNQYQISGFIYNNVIAAFTNFVFLFMVISAFGMCCGYLDKMLENKISLDSFYISRYKKILPFFALLVLLDVVLSPSKASLIEGFADLTLLFGLFPSNISVIGVGWFLGLIFAFYLIFPFYCILLKSRKRAWIAFAVSLALNYVCGSYFNVGRSNIIYCMCYLIAGGLVYLYRDKLENLRCRYWWSVMALLILSVILYFAIGANTFTCMVVSVTMLIWALGHRGGGTSELLHKILQFNQYGGVSLTYGYVSCD
jgi:peptidoglycan/LPS O-acetylase OafA/YrhL